MTCIVGLAERGTVYMGGDSATMWQGSRDLIIKRDPKVFPIGEMLMGVSGSTRWTDLVRFTLDLPEHNPADSEAAYMRVVAEAMRKLASTHGHNSGKEPEAVEGAVLIGYRGNLYMVMGDFAVTEPADEFAVLGCGDQVANGAMFATKGRHPLERISLALAAAERFSGGVRGPFAIHTLPEQ